MFSSHDLLLPVMERPGHQVTENQRAAMWTARQASDAFPRGPVSPNASRLAWFRPAPGKRSSLKIPVAVPPVVVCRSSPMRWRQGERGHSDDLRKHSEKSA